MTQLLFVKVAKRPVGACGGVGKERFLADFAECLLCLRRFQDFTRIMGLQMDMGMVA